MSKKLYSKSTYHEPKHCDGCGEPSDWIHLITVKPSPIDQWLFNKEYLHLCPECYLSTKDHKYVRGELK